MMPNISPKVRDRLDTLPDKPGCYLMRNADDVVIYVGKAVVLKNRVRSYFNQSAQRHPKTAALVAEIADISWWVTQSELDALILENELIKRYKPHYNIRLKDDRQYPYIKVNWQDDFPRIEIVRKMNKDGARYFGPYTSSTACYQTLDALRRIFPYLDCDRVITGQDPRPCLYYHIKMCGGPCIGRQNRTEYRATVKQLMDFLGGSTDQVLRQMEEQMARAADNLQFELAALYRDRYKSAQRIAEQQKIIDTGMEDADYVAVGLDERTTDAAVQVYNVRGGRLIGRENFMLEGNEVPEADVNQQGAVIGGFLQQFYEESAFLPRLILVQAMPDDWAVLEQWLAAKRGAQVELRVPQRGPKAKLMEMAAGNAAEYLRVQRAERAADTNRQTQALTELQEALQLPTPPIRIECFDISTLQGTNTVASMVVFAKGTPFKGAYKRFKIRGKGGQGEPDDFASMREVLRRRFRRAVEERSDQDPGKKARKVDESWTVLPDLLIVDGGKGQLGVAVEVLEEFDLSERVPVIGLAKREEELFRPGRSEPLWLARGSQALYLLQRVRDETHRFAITYHRALRSKEQTKSILDKVRGIGPKRRKALLTYFNGNIERIRDATVEELSTIPGMDRRAAEAVKAQL